MKIVVIAPTEIPARRANTLQVMKMSQAFCEMGHQVRLLAPQSVQSKQPPESEDQHSWKSLAHHYGLKQSFDIEWLPARDHFRRYDFSWRAIQRAKILGAQLIYTRLPQSAALSSLAGLATILEMHDFPQGKMGPFLLRAFLLGRGAQRLVIITRALHKDLTRSFNIPTGDNFTQIAPDGVDLDRYHNLPDPPAARQMLRSAPPASLVGLIHFPENFESKFTAGYTGHLYPGRGSQLLLEIATQLPDINFLIAGGEPQDVENLRMVASAHNLDNVLLTGFVPNTELPWLQAACDVLLMPYQEKVSASSGGDIGRYLSPMKLFEYMACQRAILSSNLPVLQEVLNSQNAVLLPPKDSFAWVQALRNLKENAELRNQLGRQARQDVSLYTWQARARRILEGIVIEDVK